MSTVADQWLLLHPKKGELLSTQPVGATLSQGDSFIGVDDRDHRHCLIPVGDAKVLLDQRSTSVWLVGQQLQIAGETRLYADLVCIDRQLFPVFTLLVDEVLRRAAIAEEPLLAVFESLNDWRALLQNSRAHGPDWETLVGLRGELELLKQLVSVSGPGAIEFWTGPNGSRFDFTGPSSAIEVKSSVAQSGADIHVSGLRQLTPLVGQRLVIAYLRLEENHSGASIHELVQALLALGCDRDELFGRLEKLSYNEAEPAWGRGFSLLEQCLWNITDDFPGLREDRISPLGLKGVSQLQYKIDLHSAGDAFDEGQRHNFLAGFVTGAVE